MSEHLLDPLSRVSIGLVNPKSATNVASVLRACGCYGGNAIFYTGERYRHAKAFHADTQTLFFGVFSDASDDVVEVEIQVL